MQQMLDLDIIQASKSDWSAPVVLVGKKDGTSRFCVDFRKLNAITKKDAFPLPLIDQILDCLEGAQFYSSLDLAAGYWQVPLTESARPKTAFSTPDGGHYEYKRLPFGLCNALATFQRLMNQLFKEELYDFVTIFLDDVLIYSQKLEEHLQHLKIVMERLASAGLKLKPSKCKLIQRAVSYLGYHIGADGIWQDEGKLSALSKWPEPTNTTEIRSFVGFCSYYRRFVKDFAGIAKPLHELTKKHQRFYWNENCQRSFEDLKNKLIGAPILSHPNYDRLFVLDTDASNNSIAAVLSNLDSNTENPLAFASRVLTGTEVNYSTTKREALAVVQAIKWFRSYLLGIPFHTSDRPRKFTMAHSSECWQNDIQNDRGVARVRLPSSSLAWWETWQCRRSFSANNKGTWVAGGRGRGSNWILSGTHELGDGNSEIARTRGFSFVDNGAVGRKRGLSGTQS